MYIQKINLLVFLNFVNLSGVCIQPVTGQPFSSGASPLGIAFSPLINGKLFSSVVNSGDNTITTYEVNTSTGPSSGVFTPVSAPVGTGGSPAGVAYSPLVNNNVFVAVANLGGNVTAYSANTITGILSTIGSFPAGAAPDGIAFSPSVNGNLFAAAVNLGTSNVTVYSVNTMTGFFTQVPGSPFSTGLAPSGIAFSPFVNGNLFAAVANRFDSTISVYSVNITTGFFTLLSTVTLAGFPFSIAFSPLVLGKLFALVSDETNNAVVMFQVNTATGAFTQVSTAPSGTNPLVVAFSPLVNGILLAGVSNNGSSNVSIYNVNTSTGSLSELTSAGSPFSTGPNPFGFAFSSAINQRLFFTTANSGANNFSVYKVIYAPILLSAALDCATGIVTVTGSSADTSSVITVFADGTVPLGTGSPDSAGNFNFSTSIPLIGSSHTISVTQTVGSCTTEQSPSLEVQTHINAPLLTTAALNCATGLVQLMGSNAHPTSTITAFSNGSIVLGSATADSAGNFNFKTSVPLITSITHTITVTQMSNGCISGPSNGIVLKNCISPIQIILSALTQTILNKYCKT